MIRTLWIARTGINAQQVSLEVIANNLANLSTPGFKRQRPVFEDLLYQTLRQPGAQSSQSTQIPSGLQIGTGVSPVATATIFTPVSYTHLDVYKRQQLLRSTSLIRRRTITRPHCRCMTHWVLRTR